MVITSPLYATVVRLSRASLAGWDCQGVYCQVCSETRPSSACTGAAVADGDGYRSLLTSLSDAPTVTHGTGTSQRRAPVEDHRRLEVCCGWRSGSMGPCGSITWAIGTPRRPGRTCGAWSGTDRRGAHGGVRAGGGALPRGGSKLTGIDKTVRPGLDLSRGVVRHGRSGCD
jgi:hypothetical protein